MELANLGVYS
ncbi:rCG57323 [Rattus norvegicus]|uniref:RCG57323 n=1 Tax=Rattus norvegicus TaxID=10116 RepID=A6JP99_RAT|nr:rCG57323 [Rattus norvegicus]